MFQNIGIHFGRKKVLPLLEGGGGSACRFLRQSQPGHNIIHGTSNLQKNGIMYFIFHLSKQPGFPIDHFCYWLKLGQFSCCMMHPQTNSITALEILWKFLWKFWSNVSASIDAISIFILPAFPTMISKYHTIHDIK